LVDCREYRYVGPREIINSLPKNSGCIRVQDTKDIIRWIIETDQIEDYAGFTVTFIVDTGGNLWINDRHSEHVLCASGENVLSAGEITFQLEKDQVEVIEVTNQSTGYCPEPESWLAVKNALQSLEIPHPPDFTMKCIFRLCKKCGTKNLVKDDWYVCSVCDSELSKNWNID